MKQLSVWLTTLKLSNRHVDVPRCLQFCICLKFQMMKVLTGGKGGLICHALKFGLITFNSQSGQV